jgi:hypothetical protein
MHVSDAVELQLGCHLFKNSKVLLWVLLLLLLLLWLFDLNLSAVVLHCGSACTVTAPTEHTQNACSSMQLPSVQTFRTYNVLLSFSYH